MPQIPLNIQLPVYKGDDPNWARAVAQALQQIQNDNNFLRTQLANVTAKVNN